MFTKTVARVSYNLMIVWLFLDLTFITVTCFCSMCV